MSSHRIQVVTDRPPSDADLTEILNRFGQGDRGAGGEILSRIGVELRRIASWHMSRERKNHTLQTTALLHEVFLKLSNVPQSRWHDRKHFVAVASRAMRQILVDYARARAAASRTSVSIDVSDLHSSPVTPGVLDVDKALDELSAFAPRQAELIELRFFGGLTLEESAELMGISARTADKDWALAKGWMRRRLATGQSGQ